MRLSCFTFANCNLLAPTLLTLAAAQFPPEPEGLTEIKSKFHDGIKISYKEAGICETTPGVRSYSGYIHLPPHTLSEFGESQEYPINTFFWFFESRKDPHHAPLSIWLNGGPGASSMVGALTENGPCFIGNDSNSTYLNPWSWNNEVNVLYIDQPNQVGYSYDVPTNCTVNSLPWDMGLLGDESEVKVANFTLAVPEQNATFWVGTFGSQNMTYTANSTHHSAVAMWHFAETWFEEFPSYKPHDERISLWAESYGGKYGPAIMNFFEHQNELITNGTIEGPGTHYFHLDTLGIINGCIDSLCHSRSYTDFAWNNTYGVKALNDSQYHDSMYQITRPGGFEDQIIECENLAREADPNDIGDINRVNEVCGYAMNNLSSLVTPYLETKKYGWFDVTHPLADAFPPMYATGFLNQHWVQKALGVPVNHSMATSAVASAFWSTGDMIRGGQLEEIAYLLDHGVKVTLVYGDRDFGCNWIGGEVSSKNIPYSKQASFLEAGYAPVATNPFYSGGRVRQHGNFSFSRIYQAGHMVPSYQPETAYKIFMRALHNKDIATGSAQLTDEYSTEGPSSTWEFKNDLLPAPEPQCYTLGAAMISCTDEHRQWLKDGTAIVKDFILVGRKKKDTRANWAGEEDSQLVLGTGNE